MDYNLRFSSHEVGSKKSLGGEMLSGAEGIFSPNNRTTNAVFDELTKTNITEQEIDYRCFYVVNESTDGIDIVDPAILFYQYPQADIIELGLITDKQVVADLLANENTAPRGIQFKKYELNEKVPLIQGTTKKLSPGEFVGFWIKRVPKNSGSSSTQTAHFGFTINTRS